MLNLGRTRSRHETFIRAGRGSVERVRLASFPFTRGRPMLRFMVCGDAWRGWCLVHSPRQAPNDAEDNAAEVRGKAWREGHSRRVATRQTRCSRGALLVQATDADLKKLAPLKNLRELDLSETKVTEAGLKEPGTAEEPDSASNCRPGSRTRD